MRDGLSLAAFRLTPVAVVKPPVKPKPSVTVKIGTANIQNFNPDLTDAQVRADVKKMGRITELLLMQEIGEKADVVAIDQTLKALDASWFATRSGGTGARSNVTAWKQSHPLASADSVEVVKIGPGIPGAFAPDQYLTIKKFTVKGLPLIEVHNIHYIQGAFSKPGQPGDADGTRIRTWNTNFANHKKYVLEAHNAGHIVIFGGDWNRQLEDIPKFHAAQQWAVGTLKGIDGIAVLVPPSIAVVLDKTAYVTPLNSDHDGKSRAVTFRVK
jgi:hypothetical protein